VTEVAAKIGQRMWHSAPTSNMYFMLAIYQHLTFRLTSADTRHTICVLIRRAT
jgi:hypothetical protein